MSNATLYKWCAKYGGMDLKDIRSKFGNKYDNAIKEIVEYTKTLNPNDFKSIDPK